MQNHPVPVLNGILLPQRISYPAHEAAMLLGISTKSLARLRQRGLIFPSVALRRASYPLEEIQRYLRETSTRQQRVG